MGPVREITLMHNNLKNISANEFPPILYDPHILQALESVSSTVSPQDLKKYILWNSSFGTYKKLEAEVEHTLLHGDGVILGGGEQ